MIVIGYFSYTAIETCIIEIRIGNARIFYASDLKWPKTVEIAEKYICYKLGVKSLLRVKHTFFHLFFRSIAVYLTTPKKSANIKTDQVRILQDAVKNYDIVSKITKPVECI